MSNADEKCEYGRLWEKKSEVSKVQVQYLPSLFSPSPIAPWPVPLVS